MTSEKLTQFFIPKPSKSHSSNFSKLLSALWGTIADADVMCEWFPQIACGLYDEVDVNVEDADLYSDTTSIAPGSAVTGGPGAPKSNPASLRTRFAAREPFWPFYRDETTLIL